MNDQTKPNDTRNDAPILSSHMLAKISLHQAFGQKWEDSFHEEQGAHFKAEFPRFQAEAIVTLVNEISDKLAAAESGQGRPQAYIDNSGKSQVERLNAARDPNPNAPCTVAIPAALAAKEEFRQALKQLEKGVVTKRAAELLQTRASRQSGQGFH